MVFDVSWEVDMLSEICCREEVQKVGCKRVGGIVNMDVEIAGEQEFIGSSGSE